MWIAKRIDAGRLSWADDWMNCFISMLILLYESLKPIWTLFDSNWNLPYHFYRYINRLNTEYQFEEIHLNWFNVNSAIELPQFIDSSVLFKVFCSKWSRRLNRAQILFLPVLLIVVLRPVWKNRITDKLANKSVGEIKSIACFFDLNSERVECALLSFFYDLHFSDKR